MYRMAAAAATNSLSKSDSLTRTFLVSDLALSSLLALLSFLLELRKEGRKESRSTQQTPLLSWTVRAKRTSVERRGEKRVNGAASGQQLTAVSLSLSLSRFFYCAEHIFGHWTVGCTERKETKTGAERKSQARIRQMLPCKIVFIFIMPSSTTDNSFQNINNRLCE